MKKILSVILSIIMTVSLMTVVYADGNAELYTFYADGMLFQQNKEVVLAGTANDGSVITAGLFKDGKLVAQGSAIAADGVFEVSFTAPAGGYDEYRIELSCNNVVFAELNDVVFGELWIANGQSNMQYSLAQEKTGAQMFEKREKLGDWLRVLLVPAVTEYNGRTDFVPAEPQNDIPGTEWVNGNDDAVYNMSAVAYFFAKDLHNDVDMPVGILNVPLGGSVISSWLSRSAIDSDKTVKDILTSFGEYYPLDEWKESERSIFYDMTANFNLKINALGCFRPAGMIWYQGESDIIFKKSPEQYAALFNLLQTSYTEHFSYDDGLLPIIFTQCASYLYHEKNGIDLVKMNEGFADIQKAEPEYRALVSIYDIPLTYIPSAGAIHPDTKKEIGERMAFSAKGLVYGGENAYTAASVKSCSVKDGKVYVTLDNAGDGLVSDGFLRGFAVAGNDGIFVGAQAEIVSADTICIYNEKVKEPVSASYAYCLGNMNANLYASENGEKSLPVSPFVVNEPENAYFWAEKQWADCETDTVFHLKDDVFTKFYSSWEGVNADIDFTEKSAFSGEKGLCVTADGEFSVSPVMTVKDGLSTVKFNDEEYDYSRYGRICFRVRNDGNNEVVFNGVKISTGADTWYSTAGDAVVIPADGKWHTVEADIDHIYLYGVNFGIKFANDKLKNISDVEFCFAGDNASVSVDAFGFSAEEKTRDSSFDVTKLYNIVEIIRIFIFNLFNKQ